MSLVVFFITFAIHMHYGPHCLNPCLFVMMTELPMSLFTLAARDSGRSALYHGARFCSQQGRHAGVFFTLQSLGCFPRFRFMCDQPSQLLLFMGQLQGVFLLLRYLYQFPSIEDYFKSVIWKYSFITPMELGLERCVGSSVLQTIMALNCPLRRYDSLSELYVHLLDTMGLMFFSIIQHRAMLLDTQGYARCVCLCGHLVPSSCFVGQTTTLTLPTVPSSTRTLHMRAGSPVCMRCVWCPCEASAQSLYRLLSQWLGRRVKRSCSVCLAMASYLAHLLLV